MALMNYYQVQVIKDYNFQLNNDGGIFSLLEDYSNFSSIFIELIDSMWPKMKLNYGEALIEELSYKYIIQMKSLSKALEGLEFYNPTKKDNQKTLDIPTITLLGRALMENYLTFYYLFIQPSSLEEQEFRIDIYHLSGLVARQQFPVDTPEQKQEKAEQAQKITRLRDKLCSNALFLNLTKEQKNELSGKKSYVKPKLLTWEKLIHNSDISFQEFKDSYSLYSNHAHSEYAALSQMLNMSRYTFDASLKNKFVKGVVILQMHLASRFILHVTKKLPMLRLVLDGKSPLQMEKLKLWSRPFRYTNNK